MKILPTGFIYDPVLRPVRDLLRRRMSLVQQRTALMLSFKSLHVRTTGQPISLGRLKQMPVTEAKALYEHPANCLIAKVQKEHIDRLTASIELIEKALLKSTRELPAFRKVASLPGIGLILGMTITLETGDISRFKTVGDFVSYSRLVDAWRTSNDKRKGCNNRKCGNKYLAWAFLEAANFARRYDERCRRWYDRKAARAGHIVAIKALACKLAKAAWHVMARGVDYDPKRLFADK
jgi:transposase